MLGCGADRVPGNVAFCLRARGAGIWHRGEPGETRQDRYAGEDAEKNAHGFLGTVPSGARDFSESWFCRHRIVIVVVHRGGGGPPVMKNPLQIWKNVKILEPPPPSDVHYG